MSAGTFAKTYQAAIYKAAGVAFTLTEKPSGVVLFEGRKFAVITGESPDGTWVEEGFAVFDVAEKVYLAWCESGKLGGSFAGTLGRRI